MTERTSRLILFLPVLMLVPGIAPRSIEAANWGGLTSMSRRRDHTGSKA
jgi:hypothetical protein